MTWPLSSSSDLSFHFTSCATLSPVKVGATGLLVAVYSPLFDEAFLDAVDDHRRFNGRRRPSSPKSA